MPTPSPIHANNCCQRGPSLGSGLTHSQTTRPSRLLPSLHTDATAHASGVRDAAGEQVRMMPDCAMLLVPSHSTIGVLWRDRPAPMSREARIYCVEGVVTTRPLTELCQPSWTQPCQRTNVRCGVAPEEEWSLITDVFSGRPVVQVHWWREDNCETWDHSTAFVLDTWCHNDVEHEMSFRTRLESDGTIVLRQYDGLGCQSLHPEIILSSADDRAQSPCAAGRTFNTTPTHDITIYRLDSKDSRPTVMTIENARKNCKSDKHWERVGWKCDFDVNNANGQCNRVSYRTDIANVFSMTDHLTLDIFDDEECTQWTQTIALDARRRECMPAARIDRSYKVIPTPKYTMYTVQEYDGVTCDPSKLRQATTRGECEHGRTVAWYNSKQARQNEWADNRYDFAFPDEQGMPAKPATPRSAPVNVSAPQSMTPQALTPTTSVEPQSKGTTRVSSPSPSPPPVQPTTTPTFQPSAISSLQLIPSPAEPTPQAAAMPTEQPRAVPSQAQLTPESESTEKPEPAPTPQLTQQAESAESTEPAPSRVQPTPQPELTKPPTSVPIRRPGLSPTSTTICASPSPSAPLSTRISAQTLKSSNSSDTSKNIDGSQGEIPQRTRENVGTANMHEHSLTSSDQSGNSADASDGASNNSSSEGGIEKSQATSTVVIFDVSTRRVLMVAAISVLLLSGIWNSGMRALVMFRYRTSISSHYQRW